MVIGTTDSSDWAQMSAAMFTAGMASAGNASSNSSDTMALRMPGVSMYQLGVGTTACSVCPVPLSPWHSRCVQG